MRSRILLGVAIATIVAAGAAFLVLQQLQASKYPRRADAVDAFEARRTGFDPNGPGQPVLGDVLEDYLSLCQQASVGKGRRSEEGFVFPLGGAANDAYDFNLAYVRLDDRSSSVSDCRAIEPSADFGKCQFELDADWRLDYEWISRDYLDSLAEPE
ncbi:MAG: hypothetical protein P8X81_06390 [Woeseiaceae bacterium]